MAEYIQVLTTTARRDEAEQIASSLLEERLAGCVQLLGPISSSYRWQDKIETSQEWLCLIKSRRDLLPQLEQAIRNVHPYEVPEILALPILSGHGPYLAWLEAQLQAPPGPAGS